MKWTFEYQEESNLVRVNEEGCLNLKDHARKMRELTAQPYWQPGINILFDLVKVDLSDLNYNDIRKMVDKFVADDQLLGCNKIALLMHSITDFGQGRQFEMLSDDKMCADIRVFLDENLALRWLND